MSAIAVAIAAAGILLLLVSALGLFRLPDALARQHAATKSVTLALGLILFGAALHVGEWDWWWRVALILLFLVLTLPVASHMLARAAARHAYVPHELEAAPRIGHDGSADSPEEQRQP